jgi:hypothetical protein
VSTKAFSETIKHEPITIPASFTAFDSWEAKHTAVEILHSSKIATPDRDFSESAKLKWPFCHYKHQKGLLFPVDTQWFTRVSSL